ncbi:MAG: STAS/SEC14 domain-containing protein [Hyphomicrobiales bacterium]|nr:STAS/SEC14 domain-containing protein [Hyphomicrobiales bacterium]
MIEILPETAGNVIAIKLSGMISEADFDASASEIAPLVEDERTNLALVDWSELEGWEPGAKSVGTWFGMHHWATIRRIAILADRKWDDERQRIADIFKAADVRRFSPQERDTALQWLTGS